MLLRVGILGIAIVSVKIIGRLFAPSNGLPWNPATMVSAQSSETMGISPVGECDLVGLETHDNIATELYSSTTSSFQVIHNRDLAEDFVEIAIQSSPAPSATTTVHFEIVTDDPDWLTIRPDALDGNPLHAMVSDGAVFKPGLKCTGPADYHADVDWCRPGEPPSWHTNTAPGTRSLPPVVSIKGVLDPTSGKVSPVYRTLELVLDRPAPQALGVSYNLIVPPSPWRPSRGDQLAGIGVAKFAQGATRVEIGLGREGLSGIWTTLPNSLTFRLTPPRGRDGYCISSSCSEATVNVSQVTEFCGENRMAD